MQSQEKIMEINEKNNLEQNAPDIKEEDKIGMYS